jgi:hypothetical protein
VGREPAIRETVVVVEQHASVFPRSTGGDAAHHPPPCAARFDRRRTTKPEHHVSRRLSFRRLCDVLLLIVSTTIPEGLRMVTLRIPASFIDVENSLDSFWSDWRTWW